MVSSIRLQKGGVRSVGAGGAIYGAVVVVTLYGDVDF
jgi:hypothetical protein